MTGIKERLGLIRLLFGDPMNVLSSCLRSVIIPEVGKEFFCADYAAIEARVLFWMAKHQAGVRAFENDQPIYEEMASAIYGVPVSKIAKDSIERQVGKAAVLGCGFGLGHKKFREACLNQGIEISEQVAQAAVKTYREVNKPVVQLWYNIERAAVCAVLEKKKIKINYTTWWVEDDFLWCALPSGRRLAYYKPEIRMKETPWGEKKPTLYHWEIGRTRKWELGGTYGGKLVENIVQATARDIMKEAELRLEASGYEMVLPVHDEELGQRDIGKGSLTEFEKLMAQVPKWGVGLPIKVAGWTGNRYRK